jgi:F-type H+-transporting ATPase subunit b
MSLTPDHTLLVEVVVFVALWFGLTKLVFQPMRRVLDDREDRTFEAEAEAAHLYAGAQTARDDYEKTLHDMRVELSQESLAARARMQEEQARTLAEARTAAAEQLAATRSALAEQVQRARRTLAGEAQQIATAMLARVVGEDVA